MLAYVVNDSKLFAIKPSERLGGNENSFGCPLLELAPDGINRDAELYSAACASDHRKCDSKRVERLN